MPKKNKKQSKSKPAASGTKKQKVEEDKVTWEEVVAMSDSDDDQNIDMAGVELNAKAKNLRQAIAEGKFDGILSKMKSGNESDGEEDEDFEEDVLDGSCSEDDEQDEDANEEQPGEQSDSNQEEQEEEGSSDSEDDGRKVTASSNLTTNDEGEESDEEEEEEDTKPDPKMEKYKRLEDTNNVNSKALGVVTAELVATHSKLPWAETFVCIPSTPLPFGEHGDPEANPLDIHDDLKREVAFYNTALEAVHQARDECKKANVPFSRPDDFFAEMVKTDGTFFKAVMGQLELQTLSMFLSTFSA